MPTVEQGVIAQSWKLCPPVGLHVARNRDSEKQRHLLAFVHFTKVILNGSIKIQEITLGAGDFSIDSRDYIISQSSWSPCIEKKNHPSYSPTYRRVERWCSGPIILKFVVLFSSTSLGNTSENIIPKMRLWFNFRSGISNEVSEKQYFVFLDSCI